MGLVETVMSHVSPKTILAIPVVLAFVWYTISRINEHRRIMQLGGYGPYLRSYFPLSLDSLFKHIKATMEHNNLNHWRTELFQPVNSWTSEARVMNCRMIFTADPANLKAILATQFNDYGKGEEFHSEWKDFLGDSIFTTDGRQWHASRQLIRPQFTRDRVSDLDCFESHMGTLFRAIANGGALESEKQEVDMSRVNGRILDISELFFRYTLDVATEFLLGSDIKSLSTPVQPFAEAFNRVQYLQNIFARTSKVRPLIPKLDFWSQLRVVHQFINFYIEKALRTRPEELARKSKDDRNYTFLDALAGFTRDRTLLRDQIMSVLIAGRDTTASTLSWALYELARHPEVVIKLRNELLDTVGPRRTPTYADLKNMPYLKAIVNETLRLYPVIPFNVRRALRDTTLPHGGGPDGNQPMGVLEGTPVAYSTLLMQRRADLYPPISDKFADPDVFSPERWAHWHPKPHEYIPFNAGPRICIGQQFALTEMGYVLCRMFQRYERVVSHMGDIDGGNPMLKADIVLSPGQGVRVAFWEAQGR